MSYALLGIFLMPSPRILDPERTHRRHATCEHHLRSHHSDPAERRKILRRAARRQRRVERERAERARLEQFRVERARALAAALDRKQADDDAASNAELLDESNLNTVQAAADPQDDDSRMKKGRRRGKLKPLFWTLQEPPRIRLSGDFLAMLRLYIDPEGARISNAADALPHFGSGPCHSFPRPREGTIMAHLPLMAVQV
ncbi:MAG TPA: hypothetical protein VGV60_12685 [Candidatus Polarisedimenticolia bacterium]|jgi:hypothetical protein|nr:hypothetical protein [Candidatus Polarisedimenticolia bacterium]